MRNGLLSLVGLGLIALLPGMFCGCQTVPKHLARKSQAPFQEVRLVYDLSGQYRDIPLNRSGIDLVSDEQPATRGPLERWTSARLQNQYPHPEGRAEMARATLRLSGHLTTSRKTQPATNGSPYLPHVVELPELFSADDGDDFALPSARDDEVWILDFPRQQLDLLMADLKSAGFFDSQLRTDPGTRLEVELDHQKTSKSWTPEPRLDDFIARVHKEGRLSGFVSRSDPPPDSFAAQMR